MIGKIAGMICLLLLAGCDHDSGKSSDTYDYAPRPSDDQLSRGPATIDSAELLILESYPPQYNLQLAGTLPTPCHAWRAAVAPPDAAKQIDVEVYSVVDPGIICIQVIEVFEGVVAIPTPPPGRYTVRVNDQSIGVISY